MKIPLFDLDGTLFKSGIKTHLEVFNHSFETIYGVKGFESEVDTRGMTDKEIVIKVLALHGISKNKVEEKYNLMRQEMTDYFNEICKIGDYVPLPGVLELLTELKNNNIPIGTLTGNTKGIGLRKLETAGIKNFFDFGAFGDLTDKRVELVEIAKKEAEWKFNKQFSLDNFAIIGDTPRDIKCARDGGIAIVAVSTGEFNFETLKKENPDLIVHDLTEIDTITKFLS